MKIVNKVLSEVVESDIVDGEFNFPDGIEEIGYCAFTFNRAIEIINVPSSVKLIETYAFANCSSLYKVIMPDDVILGDKIFVGCHSLRRINKHRIKTFRGDPFVIESEEECDKGVMLCKGYFFQNSPGIETEYVAYKDYLFSWADPNPDSAIRRVQYEIATSFNR